jgi:hypothetical protein
MYQICHKYKYEIGIPVSPPRDTVLFHTSKSGH